MKTNTIETVYVMPGMINPVHDYECGNGHKWTATPRVGPTANISGEMSQYCPECGSKHSFASSVYDKAPAVSEYDQQATDFLSRHGIKFRATLSDSKTPAWAKEGEECGHHYRVTLSGPSTPKRRVHYSLWFEGRNSGNNRDACEDLVVHECDTKDAASSGALTLCERFKRGERFVKTVFIYGSHGSQFGHFVCKTMEPEANVFVNFNAILELDSTMGVHRTWLRSDSVTEENPIPSRRLVFDFWSSIADAKAGVLTVSAYSVLACISGDAYTPETFADFCAEYGYEADSIKALQMFRRCDRFANRLRAFFTESELSDLAEIN